ncbi:MAG: HAD family phosphatase [Oscillospiraceae bacterium]|nr:HAD family phosphatase [Oscillospiraceae bacterium]
MAIKLIALDIDGTLVNSRMEITDATVQALERAVEHGIRIVLSTGRLVVECTDILQKLPCIRYVNGCTGAEVTDLATGRSVAGKRISGDEARRLYNKLKDMPIMICPFNEDCIPRSDRYHWQKCLEEAPRPVAQHMERFYEPIDDLDAYMASVQKLIKFYFPCFTKETVEEFKRRMADEPYTVLQCGPFDMEIMPVGADKGDGLRMLAESLGLTAHEVMAIGDSENDIEMLRYAGLPVVMGNGLPHVKPLARYITDDNDHDGVAKAVNMVLEGTL